MTAKTKKVLLGINHSILFLCTSMYLGTGWSLILFTFPIAPQLTPDNYYLQFVPQVTAATEFFTPMTMLMIATAIIMIIAEWRSYMRWFPIGVLLGVILATVLTTIFIFPYNEQMSAGITDALKLKEVLQDWMNLHFIRNLFWTGEWLCMMAYFFNKYLESTTTKSATVEHRRYANMAI